MITVKPWCMAIGFLAFGLGGCATYDVHVNGFTDQVSVPGKNYVVISTIKDVPESDLQFKEAADYLQKALTTQGYTRVDDPKKADLGVLLYYGIGNPETKFSSFSSPIWGLGGGTATVVTGTGKNRTITTVNQPGYAFGGYNENVVSYTAYTMSMTVSAVDFAAYRDAKEMKEFWKTEIYCTDLSRDLRKIIPVLIAAGAPYFGTDTGRAVRVPLSGDSKAVEALTGPAK
jgi:hypothetical protein